MADPAGMPRATLLSKLLPFVCAALPAQEKHPGYKDTPLLPSGFHVHDSDRPHPRVVDPGPAPTAPAPVPADAVVLFDGKDLTAFVGADGPARWEVADGAMVVNRTGDVHTRAEFGDCQVHLEWQTPTPAKGHGQDRGNSGVFLCDRYEVQVLDSYDNETYADGQAAALYGQEPPMVNACRPPGQWQSYDIVFVAPRFAADGALVSPARVTVLHNGILVHHDRALLGPTGHRTLAHYEAHGDKGPIRLQDHGNPVRYRNLWVRPLTLPPAATDGQGR